MKKKLPVIRNKRATFDYEILDKIETGLVLEGCEVKSVRASQVSLKDSYVRFFNDELWLIGCYFTPYTQGSAFSTNDPTRNRKVLIKKKEAKKLQTKVNEKGYTIVPLKLYFSRQYVKLQIGLAKAKKTHDKRRDLKEKDANREIDRAMKGNY